jgi:hypothetical protein
MPQPQPVFRSDEEEDEGEERQDRGQFNGGNAGNGGNNGNAYGERGQGFQGGPQPAFLSGAGEGQSGGEDEDDEPIGDSRFETRPQPQYNEPSERGERNFQNNNNGGGGHNRQQAGGQNEQREGGNYRGRRRRPYRERFGDRERGAGGEGGQPAVAEAPPGDD